MLDPVEAKVDAPKTCPVLVIPSPVSFAPPKFPTEQLSVAAIRTQMGRFAGRALMVVENPVTVVLYNHFPFSVPYWMLNVSVPEYGPQLIKILVGLTLLDSIMFGVT
ncbi:MAG: hypothetical protein ABSA43_01690 [Candidatus Microgenomates bacterium]